METSARLKLGLQVCPLPTVQSRDPEKVLLRTDFAVTGRGRGGSKLTSGFSLEFIRSILFPQKWYCFVSIRVHSFVFRITPTSVTASFFCFIMVHIEILNVIEQLLTQVTP